MVHFSQTYLFSSTGIDSIEGTTSMPINLIAPREIESGRPEGPGSACLLDDTFGSGIQGFVNTPDGQR